MKSFLAVLLVISGLVAVLFVVGLERCLEKGGFTPDEQREQVWFCTGYLPGR